jgi:hypothetical protein
MIRRSATWILVPLVVVAATKSAAGKTVWRAAFEPGQRRLVRIE